MRIVMVIGQFYPFIGGAEQQCLKLAHELHRRGHIVEVVTARPSRRLARFAVVEGITVERAGYPRLGFLAWLAMFLAVCRRARTCDIIHAHQCLWPAFSAVLAGLLCRKPVICKIGNSGDYFDLEVLRGQKPGGRLMAAVCRRWISRFVWTSSAVKADLLGCGLASGALIGIPNGVELEPLPHRRPKDQEKLRLVCVGSLTAKKNLSMVLEAISRLSGQERSRIRLDIAGDGVLRRSLEERCCFLGLEQSVSFLGNQSDIRAVLLRSDCFVLVSYSEGLSNAALEAMACGLPLVLSRQGGNKDLIDTRQPNGFFVDVNNPDALADVFKRCLNERELLAQMGECSRVLAEKHYSLSAAAGRYEALYRSLTEGQ